jgi:hypothetical protein
VPFEAERIRLEFGILSDHPEPGEPKVVAVCHGDKTVCLWHSVWASVVLKFDKDALCALCQALKEAEGGAPSDAPGS